MPVLSAMQRTLGVAELLEQILVHVPMEDLFLFQRTNQKFRDIIASSPALRLIMHLELQPAVWEESNVHLDASENRSVHQNSWIRDSIPLKKALSLLGRNIDRCVLHLNDKRIDMSFIGYSFKFDKPVPPRSTMRDSWRSMVAGHTGYVVNAHYSRHQSDSSIHNRPRYIASETDYDHFASDHDKATLGDVFDGLFKQSNSAKGCYTHQYDCKKTYCEKH